MNLAQDWYFKTQKTQHQRSWACFCFCFVFLPPFDHSINNEGTSVLHLNYLWKSLVETSVAGGNLGLYRPVLQGVLAELGELGLTRENTMFILKFLFFLAFGFRMCCFCLKIRYG